MGLRALAPVDIFNNFDLKERPPQGTFRHTHTAFASSFAAIPPPLFTCSNGRPALSLELFKVENPSWTFLGRCYVGSVGDRSGGAGDCPIDLGQSERRHGELGRGL